MHIEKIINQIKEIEKSLIYPVITLNNPDSNHSKIISGEIVAIESLERYFIEEFSNLSKQNISIEISR